MGPEHVKKCLELESIFAGLDIKLPAKLHHDCQVKPSAGIEQFATDHHKRRINITHINGAKFLVNHGYTSIRGIAFMMKMHHEINGEFLGTFSWTKF
jgi:hypothetical protein